MAVPILTTKLFIPQPRSNVVLRPRLIERLNKGLQSSPGVTLISAPAGFGKTTLVSEWVKDLRSALGKVSRFAWFSLDEGDNDPTRFLLYLIAALQTVSPDIGTGVLGMLQSPQPPPPDTLLATLLNEITTIQDTFLLILDDYHVIDARPVDQVLTFLLEHQPPRMHLVITTREDPDLPLARFRARGQLSELRAADLRFTHSEADEFLNRRMGLELPAENISALETRTEGWIAGLQLAALSIQGEADPSIFIQSFTGSHRFVMDYLVEEVLHRQPEHIQTFLLESSILNRMCGSLCDAVLSAATGSGQATLDYLERANLFLVSLDNERRWYRYHHLFADLLRQRLQQSIPSGDARNHLNDLHIRASRWYEDNGLQMEAFQHAAAANDIERAERLIDGKGIPLHFSGGVTPILAWLESLPLEVLNARPSLWWRHAAMLLINGQTIGVGEKLQAAEEAVEAVLQGAEPDDETRNLIGQIAAARSTLALTRYDIDMMLSQSARALEYLHPDNLFTRATAHWTRGYAQLLQGDRAAARQSLTEAISLSQTFGAMFTAILATIGLGNVQEADNELHAAAETYRRVLEWAGDHPQQIISEAHLGLARVLYEWNDLDAAQSHGEQSLALARQYEQIIDRYIISEIFLARLKLARGDAAGAAALLGKTSQTARRYNFVHRLPEVAAAQVLTLIRQGNLSVAADLVQTYEHSVSRARLHLAQGDTRAALKVLESWQQLAESRDWKDERLKAMILQAVTLQADGNVDGAERVLGEALELAEPEGFVRLFVDEGPPMASLLTKAASQGILPGFVSSLLAAFEGEPWMTGNEHALIQPLVEPLSPRELEVLRLIAQGLSNDEIGSRLFLALDTVKGHNRRIFDKLQVQRRTEAVARARELGLL